jgi:uncharacterized protein
MSADDPDRAVEFLDERECHALLRSAPIGRLGFTRNALPAIQPVAFSVHDGQVIIPARTGSELLAGTRRAVVAFEIDAYDASASAGWSVMVVGASRTVTDAAEIAACDALPWSRPSTATDRRYIAVRIGLIRGWRTALR